MKALCRGQLPAYLLLLPSEYDSISVNEFELLGAKTAPLDAWLLMRSLRTLPIRMKAHQENALKVANFLLAHPKVEKVKYPGLKSFPQHELAKKQMSGFSGLMAFRLKTNDLTQALATIP